MKYFKITKTWAVKAETEAEAIRLVASRAGEISGRRIRPTDGIQAVSAEDRLGHCCQGSADWQRQRQALVCLPTVHHTSCGEQAQGR
jgi:hypothetical protein